MYGITLVKIVEQKNLKNPQSLTYLKYVSWEQ